MWTLSPAGDEEQDPLMRRRLKAFCKTNVLEVRNCFRNLDLFLKHLDMGGLPQQFSRARSEGRGLFAVDQHGPDDPPLELRLYVYPDSNRQVLHVMLLGDKRTQAADIRLCQQTILRTRDIDGTG
jgi:hypothetical protein